MSILASFFSKLSLGLGSRGENNKKVEEVLATTLAVPLAPEQTHRPHRLTSNERIRLQWLEEAEERRRWNEEYPDDNETEYGW